MRQGDKVTCVITGIRSYGIFVDCSHYAGLIHISEISDQFVSSIEDIFEVGDDITSEVLEVDDARQRLRLSYRKAHPVHPRIRKSVPIKKGFHPLSKALQEWILETDKKQE